MSLRSLALLCVLTAAACGGGDQNPPGDNDAGQQPVDAGTDATDAGENPADAGEDETDAGEPIEGGGETCADALPATIGATLEGTTEGTTNDVQHTTGCTSRGLGMDRVYRVSLPAGHLLSASVETLDGLFDPAVILRDASVACGVELEGCLASDDMGNAAAVNTARWHNPATTAKDVFVIVDSADEEATGPFKLTLASEFHETAANETCTGATPLTVGTPVTGDALSGATVDDYAGLRDGCATGGPELAYALVVPAGKQVTVTGTPEAGLDLVLNVIPGSDAAHCADAEVACVASADEESTGEVEVVTWVNESASDASIFVLVEPFLSGSGTFSLEAALGDPPPPPPPAKGGETCDEAYVLSPPELLTSEELGDAANDLDPTQNEESCTGYVTKGPDRTYKVTVPAGQILLAEVLPEAGADVGLYLIASVAACTAEPLVCLTGNDDASGGMPDEIEWANDTGADAEVVIVVDTYVESPGDFYYDLDVSIEVP